jgi:hypothetical protein
MGGDSSEWPRPRPRIGMNGEVVWELKIPNMKKLSSCQS